MSRELFDVTDLDTGTKYRFLTGEEMTRRMAKLSHAACEATWPDDIAVGDRVRSHDFPDQLKWGKPSDCYVEGTVADITEPIEGCRRYRIRVTRGVFDGKEVERAAEVFPPLNGTPTWLGGFTFGVECIEPKGGFA